jgi:hypothetical protein
VARSRRLVKTGFKVYQHSELSKATQEEITKDPSAVLKAADQGIQTAIVSADGKRIRSIVGLNGTRYLPDPDSDPLDEILRSAIMKEQK